MDFVKEIEINVGKDAIIEFADAHPADAKQTWADTTKIEKLGYKSTTDIQEGVANFYQWYKNYLGKNA